MTAAQETFEERAEREAHERARVLDALEAQGSGALLALHVAAVCDLPVNVVRQRLGQLLAEGLVRRTYGEFWEVKP